jgi:hypothetical protein
MSRVCDLQRMRWIIPALAAAAMAGGAAALPRSMATHSRLAAVQPAPGVLADYEAHLRSVFRDASGPGVRLRAIVRPAFDTEYAVGLRQAGKGFEIFALRPGRQVWAYQGIKLNQTGRAGVIIFDKPLSDRSARPSGGIAEEITRLEKDLPADPADLPLSHCAAAVDASLAASLNSAWRLMLEAVRPEEELMPGLDGTFYLFSMELEGRALAGETWTPREGTRPAKLARLAEAMREYCETKAGERLAEIGELARSLENVEAQD